MPEDYPMWDLIPGRTYEPSPAERARQQALFQKEVERFVALTEQLQPNPERAPKLWEGDQA